MGIPSALLLTAAVIGWTLWQLPPTYRDYAEAERDRAKAFRLKEKIVLYDEVLTMSARLCASTGETCWSERYFQHEPLLDQALKEAAQLSTGPGQASKTQAANQLLVGREHQALELASEGQLQSAQQLFDDEYERQKRTYSQGVLDFQHALLAQTEQKLARARQRLELSACLLGLISTAMLGVWLQIFRHTNSWNNLLCEQNRHLVEAQSRLESQQQSMLQTQKLELAGTLASGVAHDLNNQLVPILGHVDLLLGEPLLASQKESLESVQQAGRNCVQLVRGLMSLTRASASEPQLVHCHELISRLKDFLRHTLPSKVILECHIEEQLPPIQGISAELQSVFLNLASNARDAMPNGGRLLIMARQCDSQVEFLVKDQGCGMSQAVQERIFEPFFTTKQSPHGTGLGLFSVKKILEKHGASITAQSIPGQGSTFVVRFPAAPTPAVPQPLTPDPVLPLRVLLVDDEESIRKVLAAHLRRQGLQVVTASNGLEALEIYGSQSIDVVVSDVNMPKLDGVGLLRQLRAADPQATVVLVSGVDHNLSDTTGAAALLCKPFSIEELNRLLRLHGQQRPRVQGLPRTTSPV